MLTQYFQPEPMFKGLPLAKAFRDAGHDVEVLTGYPNYPGGTVYEGYKIRPWQRELMEGIPVNRVPLYPSHDRSGARRILNFISFSGSAFLLGPWRVQRPDVIYVYNLVTLATVARWMRMIWGCKVVVDVQDLWPESVASSGMLRSRVAMWILSSYCDRQYRKSDGLVVLSPGFKDNLVRRGVSPGIIRVVYNWCDETAIRVAKAEPDMAVRFGMAGRFNIVFAGTMGRLQGLDVVVKAARRLQDRLPGVLFTLVGGGVDVPRLKAESDGLSNVQFLPRMPMSEIGGIYSVADALLVHLRDEEIFRSTVPSKIQAYMHAGKPVLCGVRGDAANLIKEARCGLTFAPDDAEGLIAVVEQLVAMTEQERTQMGESGSRFYRNHISECHGVTKILDVLAESVGSEGKNEGDVFG